MIVSDLGAITSTKLAKLFYMALHGLKTQLRGNSTEKVFSQVAANDAEQGKLPTESGWQKGPHGLRSKRVSLNSGVAGPELSLTYLNLKFAKLFSLEERR